MRVALTRAVPPTIDQCELTHLRREPIDHARAVREHAVYEEALRTLGCRVERLPPLPDDPDSVFVEDTALVFDRVAVIARPGADSRRGEVDSTARALAAHRTLARIEAPGTLDGGDVLITPGVVFVGSGGRTNTDGVRQLAAILAPHGFDVVPVPLTACLHLKSAVTCIPPKGGNYRNDRIPPEGGNDTHDSVASAFRRNFPNRTSLLINPQWVDSAHFTGFHLIEVDPAEPEAANVLLVGETVLCAEAHVKTRRRLEAHGIPTLTVPAGELAKAEGGVTCCSIILTTDH